jgi:hypothetical protein
MAQVGGKLRQFAPHVEARPVPFDQPASREAVTKILKPWPTTYAPTPGGRPQADGTGHSGESATGYTARHSFAALGDEERLRCRSRTEFVALSRIARKGGARRVFDWNEAGLPEL